MQIDIGVTSSGKTVGLPLKRGNRHGLIAGSTGSGKTTSLQRLIEGFSSAGVPVFATDVKSDLGGVSTAVPVAFWDLYGTHGLPIRTSIQEMGGGAASVIDVAAQRSAGRNIGNRLQEIRG